MSQCGNDFPLIVSTQESFPLNAGILSANNESAQKSFLLAYTKSKSKLFPCRLNGTIISIHKRTYYCIHSQCCYSLRGNHFIVASF